jgi:tetratricopeptide (TPR) repeat protein
MTQEILPMILRLAEEDDYKPLYDNFLSGNRAFLLALAQSLKSRGRLDDAKTLCDHILEQAPQNIEALRLSIAVSGAKGNTAEALERLIFLKSTGHNPIELVDDIRQQIMLAPAAMDSLSAAGRLEDAFRISELLVALCPGVQMFVSNTMRYATLLKKEDELNKYKDELIRITAPDVKRLNEMATASHARGAFEEELKCRVEIFRHPEDAQRHSALRLENIDAALGLIFCGSVDDEKLNLVKEMMAAVPSIPPVPADGSEVNAYARFYRLYLEPFRKVVESVESDVIHCWAPESKQGGARCGHQTIAVRRTAAACDIPVI